MSYSVLIPAYNPDERLSVLVAALLAKDVERVIIVDDGSKNEEIFLELVQKERVSVITHPTNYGKGRALKNGLNFYLAVKPFTSTGIVTADADGQHLVEDIVKIGEALDEQGVIIGTRDFSGNGIPFNSRYGNKLTRKLFTFLTGIGLSDTQSGLRGIPKKYVGYFKDLPGERFDFELNMLMACKRNELPVYERPITTVYLDKNKASHFRIFSDSLRIYSVLFGFNNVLQERFDEEAVTARPK